MKHKQALIIGIVAIIAVGGAVAGLNYIQLQGPLNEVIASDSRNAGIDVSVHYGSYVNLDTLVFDVESVSEGKSITDVTRVLLMFAESVADQAFDRVELTHAGVVKFVLRGSDFETLGREYGEQNPIYTIRTLPEKLLRPDGQPAFGEWEGGMLGVLGRQMEDFRAFHEKWYLTDLGLSLPEPERGLPFENGLEAEAQAKHEEDMKKLSEKLEELEAEQTRMEQERSALEAEIETAKGDEAEQTTDPLGGL